MIVGSLFIVGNVDSIGLSMQQILSIKLHVVSILGTGREENVVTYLSGQENEQAPYRLANLIVLHPISQILLTVRAPSLGLPMVERHHHLLKMGLAMVGRSTYVIIPNRSFKTLIVNWSKLFMTLPINMLVTDCTLRPNTIWPIPFKGDSVDLSQFYKVTATRVQMMKWHYEVTKQDANQTEKHWAE